MPTIYRIQPDKIMRTGDGQFVFLFHCPHCDAFMPLESFGVRRPRAQQNGTDLITEQSWCKQCRSNA